MGICGVYACHARLPVWKIEYHWESQIIRLEASVFSCLLISPNNKVMSCFIVCVTYILRADFRLTQLRKNKTKVLAIFKISELKQK